jgi:hypothetical protein
LVSIGASIVKYVFWASINVRIKEFEAYRPIANILRGALCSASNKWLSGRFLVVVQADNNSDKKNIFFFTTVLA